MDLYFSGVLKDFDYNETTSVIHNLYIGNVLLCKVIDDSKIDVIAQHIVDGSPSNQIIISMCKISINSRFDNVKFYCNDTLSNILRAFANDITNYEMSELVSNNKPEEGPDVNTLVDSVLKKGGPFDTYVDSKINSNFGEEEDEADKARELKEKRAEQFEENKMTPEEQAEFYRMMNEKLGACNHDSESEEDDDDEEDSKPNDNYDDYDPFGPHTVGEILGIT